MRGFVGFIILLSFCIFSAPVFSDQTLAEGGRSNAVIVVAPAAADSVQTAARELQKHFQMVTDAQIPIAASSGPVTTCTIYLGDSDFSRSKGIDAAKMPPDGFQILSGDHWLIIAGKDYAGPPLTGAFNPFRRNETYNDTLKLSAFGDAGTLCGVYYFLDHYLGVRWYMPGDLGIVAPKNATLRHSDDRCAPIPGVRVSLPLLLLFLQLGRRQLVVSPRWLRCAVSRCGQSLLWNVFHQVQGFAPGIFCPDRRPTGFHDAFIHRAGQSEPQQSRAA